MQQTQATHGTILQLSGIAANMFFAAQTFFPSLDKALDTDPLTLVALGILIMALTYLATVWLGGKGSKRDDDFKQMMFTALTGENSPMVKSNLAIAKALEGLGAKTDTQTNEVTSELKGLRSDNTEFQNLITTDLSKQTETIAANTATMNTLVPTVNTLIATVTTSMAEIRLMVSQRPSNPELETRLERFRAEFFAELGNYVKRITTQMEAVKVPESLPSDTSNPTDVPPVKPEDTDL